MERIIFVTIVVETMRAKMNNYWLSADGTYALDGTQFDSKIDSLDTAKLKAQDALKDDPDLKEIYVMQSVRRYKLVKTVEISFREESV